MARVERSETDGRGSAVVTRGANETRSGIQRRSIAPRIAVSTAGSGRTTDGRETGHARQARRRDATNSSRGAKPDACWKARRKSPGLQRKSLWLWGKSLWSFRAPGGARFSSTCTSRRPIPITGSRPSPSRSRSWSGEKWLSACRVDVRQGPTSCRPLPINPPTLADGLMHN